MEGGEMKDARAGKWLEGLKKYRLAALVALLGIVLLLSVCALVYGALGDHGFNAVTAAAQSAQGVAR